MDKCIVCGNDKFEYRPYGPGFRSLPKEAKIQICTKCGLGGVTPLPDSKALDTYYRAEQYQQWHKGKDVQKLELLPHSRALSQYDSLASYFNFNKIRNVLDFGAGSAPTARTIKIRHPHITITAIELSKTLRALLTSCPEIDKVYDIIPSDLPLQDVIIISGTLEHLVNPIATIRKFRHSLIKGGYLFIEVPNCPYPFYYNIMKACVPHLFFFTQDSFRQMAPKLGFELMYTAGLGVDRKEWGENKNRLDIVIRTGLCYAPNKNGVYLRALLRKKGD